MFDDVLHVFIRIGQNVSGTNDGRNPDEIRIVNLHAVHSVVEINWSKRGLQSNCRFKEVYKNLNESNFVKLVEYSRLPK